MPEWNFLVVRHFGGRRQRQELCARIKSEVEDENLSHLLPLVKYEPSRGLEYYLGLAYDASDWDAEDEARHILVAAGIGAAANPQQSYTIAAHQVQTLLRGSLEFESFTVPIHYERVTASEMPSTAELLAQADDDDGETDNLEAEKYARLLYWCSAIGTGGLDRIKEACRLLGIDTEWGGAWSVLRRLALLGHLDISDGQSVRWGEQPIGIKLSLSAAHRRSATGGRGAATAYGRQCTSRSSSPDAPLLATVPPEAAKQVVKAGSQTPDEHAMRPERP